MVHDVVIVVGLLVAFELLHMEYFVVQLTDIIFTIFDPNDASSSAVNASASSSKNHIKKYISLSSLF